MLSTGPSTQKELTLINNNSNTPSFVQYFAVFKAAAWSKRRNLEKGRDFCTHPGVTGIQDQSAWLGVSPGGNPQSRPRRVIPGVRSHTQVRAGLGRARPHVSRRGNSTVTPPGHTTGYREIRKVRKSRPRMQTWLHSRKEEIVMGTSGDLAVFYFLTLVPAA